MVIPTPMVLAVNCPKAMVQRCAAAAHQRGVPLRECDLVTLRTAASRWRPLIILFSADVYAFDPEGFSMVAKDVGSVAVVAADERAAEAAVERAIRALSIAPSSPP